MNVMEEIVFLKGIDEVNHQVKLILYKVGILHIQKCQQ